MPRQGQSKGLGKTFSVISFGLDEGSLGQGSGGLDEDRIVEKDKGLLRNVRARTFGYAFLATGGVEGDHGWMWEAAADEGIEPAPIEIVAFACLPFAGGEIEMSPITCRLVWLYAWSTYGVYEQAADRQGGVSYEFRVESEPSLSRE